MSHGSDGPGHLKNGKLYWPVATPRTSLQRTQTLPSHTDVIVAGAGITGAMAAYHLAAAGLSVAVVDENEPLSGSTPASTAMILYDIDETLASLTDQVGPQRANAAYRASYDTLNSFPRLFSAISNDCGHAVHPSLYLGVQPSDTRTLQFEAQLRQSIGIPATYLDHEQLLDRFALDRPCAIVTPNAISLDPVRLTTALLRAAQSHGAVICPNTPFDMDRADHAPFTVRTATGATISSRWLVVATGYETPRHFAEVAALTDLTSTYALVTNQLCMNPWPEQPLIWECADPYLYVRSTPDGRLMAGGEDEPFSDPHARDQLLPVKTERILSKLQELAPHASLTAEFAWAGTFARTEDGLPFIGPHRKWPNVLFALGYGGNGITFSLLAARILRDHILGIPNTHASLFTLDRSTRQAAASHDTHRGVGIQE